MFIKKVENMLKELIQELNQILTEVDTLTKENEELKIEKETINSQLSAANESLRTTLEDKTALEAEVNTLNTTIENLNNVITEKDNKITELESRITELESQVANRIDLVELRSITAELKTIFVEQEVVGLYSISNATNSCLIHFVDVDYSTGYIKDDGNLNTSIVGWFSDNRYIEISGAITVTSECSVGIKGIRITEYDSDKNIVENNTITTSTRSVTKSLNSNTRFIRIGFNTNAARETKLPELFSTYSITNN